MAGDGCQGGAANASQRPRARLARCHEHASGKRTTPAVTQSPPSLPPAARPPAPQEAALSELEAEMAALREAAAAGEAEGARAAALEGSLATSKDQYLRLQADFDNFRRRTVRRGVWGWIVREMG